MSIKYGVNIAVIFYFIISIKPVFASEEGPVWMLQIENDYFAWLSNTDRHYTSGIRLLRLSPPTDLPNWIDTLTFVPDEADPIQRWAFSVGHSMFTPDDTGEAALIPDDRPYAGWAYFGFSFYNEFLRERGAGRQDVFAIELGIVGPSALGEQVQDAHHDVVGRGSADGWDNQLSDEPGLHLIFERKWRGESAPGAPDKLDGDIVPHIGISLGNVITEFGVGATLRYGRNLAADFGPPRIRPGLPGSDGYQRATPLDWYLFFGPEIRYVAQNIFLDGNTWKDSHSVDRRPWVLDTQVGLVLLFGGARITYTHVIMSPEFNEQREWDQFGALTLSWKF
jgi:hypothetical protein